MTLRQRIGVGVVAFVIVGTVGLGASAGPANQAADDVEVRLEAVDDEVLNLGLEHAVASEEAQDAIIQDIWKLQQEREALCAQVAADSPAKDEYC